MTVTGNGSYSTPIGYTLPTTTTVTGTYEWVASYRGDSNNNPASSRNGDEPVTVDPASPTISTAANPATVTLNAGGSPTLNDSATLAGGYNETGSIAFVLYGPDGSAVDTETVNVTGKGTYTTPAGYTLPTAGAVTGTYQWVASYSGDGNNNAVTSEGNRASFGHRRQPVCKYDAESDQRHAQFQRLADLERFRDARGTATTRPAPSPSPSTCPAERRLTPRS